MKRHILGKAAGAVALALAIVTESPAVPLGTVFTHQGRLADGGQLANGVYDFRFSLYDAASGGTLTGTPSVVTTNAVPVSNGVFTVSLNFGTVFHGEARWLATEVKSNLTAGYHLLTPRTELTPTPNALYAANAGTASAVAPGAVTSASLAPASVGGPAIADGSIGGVDLSPGLLNSTFWKLSGNTGVGNFLGSTDNQPVVIRANNQTSLRVQPTAIGPNLVGGIAANNVAPGIGGAFIGSGGQTAAPNVVNDNYAAVVAGYGNVAAGRASFVGVGVSNYAGGDFSVIGGGQTNVAAGQVAVVAGGERNHAGFNLDTVGGGGYNRVQGGASVISGGWYNEVSGYIANVGGGQFNEATATSATVAGGANNSAAADLSAVGGGSGNLAQGTNATVAGGAGNKATNTFATVGGGRANVAGGAAISAAFTPFNQALGATVSGGESNRARRSHATVAGGRANTVTTSFSTIGGGTGNIIHGIENAQAGTNCCEGASAVIGGGADNTIRGFWNFNSTISGGVSNTIFSPGSGATLANVAATIGGGSQNLAFGQYSTVPGGSRNQAAGDHSLAAGYRAKANHDGSFVWGDDMDADFASTTNKQFAVRANNGVMIQSTNTALDLRGGGALRVAGAGVGSATPVFIHRATAASVSVNLTVIDHPHCNGNPNAILFVTHNFNADQAADRYEREPFGVWYNGTRWTIFHENTLVAMPVGRAFNVMVVKP